MNAIISEVVTVPFWQGVEHIALVASIGGVAIAWLVATRKKERRRIEPDPLNVRVRQTKANEADCKERHGAALRALATLAEENTEEHKRIYDQIDEVERRAGDKLSDSLATVNETMRRLPGEMIDLLKKTGQLKGPRGD